MALVLLHNQPTAVVRFVFVSLVYVNPSRAEHDLVVRSVQNLPETKFTNERNFLGSCLFDKGVVEQLATRVVDVAPAALIVWARCLGFLTDWPVNTSLVHTCKVAVTLLQEEQINFSNLSRNPPFLNRWGRPRPCVSERYVCSSISLCSSLFQVSNISLCSSLAGHGCLLIASLHVCVAVRV